MIIYVHRYSTHILCLNIVMYGSIIFFHQKHPPSGHAPPRGGHRAYSFHEVTLFIQLCGEFHRVICHDTHLLGVIARLKFSVVVLLNLQMLHLWKMDLESPCFSIFGWEYETKDDDEL